MKQIPLEQIEQALLPQGTVMFANVITALDSDEELNVVRRRDMVSGLRQVAKVLGRDPKDVPCHAAWLQARLSKISPATYNLSHKTWQNVQSNAKAAMVQVGILNGKISRKADLTEEWQALWQLILDAKNPSLPPTLGRFVHFCSRLDIRPTEVNDGAVASYLAALVATEIRKSPYVTVRATVSSWNQATRLFSEWPQITLNRESQRKQIIRPLSDFPKSFEQAFNALFITFSQTDPLDFDSELKPLRPYSIFQYRRQLQRFAAEVIAGGLAIGDMTSLHVLCNPTNAELGLRRMLARNANKTSVDISGMARLLCRVARTINADKAVLTSLNKLADRLAYNAPRGMTQKNRTRLRVLRDDAVQSKLLNWPSVAFRRHQAQSKRDALVREEAIATILLLYCPVRGKNLASIHLDHNIKRLGDGRVFLTFEEEETKTERPQEFELPPDVVKMLDLHLATRSPFLCQPANPWLFPLRNSLGHISRGALAARIKARLFKETGIEMNTHLFRHFGAMIVLDSQPGAYELARQLLGHSQVSRTISVYSGLETYTAAGLFAEIVTTKRNGGR